MHKIISFLFSILIYNSVAYGQSKRTKLFADKSKSTITYAMNHPLHSWTAVSHDVSSVILYDKDNNTISQAVVSVRVASFDSQNANRDSHSIEVTEALKYPKITFVSKLITPKEDSLEIKGTLSFHGIKRDISFKAISKKNKSKIRIIGGFVVLMSQFNIEPPSLMGIATDDEIKISFDVQY